MLTRMSVFVRIEGNLRGAEATLALLDRYAVGMLRALKLEAAELSLVLCDDRSMRKLNREHRGLDRPTDVLAFAMREGTQMIAPQAQDLLGDIVISWQTARRQAKEHGCTVEREICLLLAHGLLHLLGFDHITRKQERRMMARTDLLMAAGLASSRVVDKPRRRTSKRADRNSTDTFGARQKAKDPERLQTR
jgi:probable rRNA maturation factor